MRFRWNKFGKNMKPQWDGDGAKLDSKWCVRGTPMDCKRGVNANNLAHTWGNSMNLIYKMQAYHLAKVDSKCCIWVELKWNVYGARVELKCHVKCWELGWGMGGIYVNS